MLCDNPDVARVRNLAAPEAGWIVGLLVVGLR